MDAWKRILKIELTSYTLGQQIVLGGKETDNLYINVNGSKYPALLKDGGVITVKNLPYSTIVKIIVGRFYKIRIIAGYEGSDPKNKGQGMTIFDGSVSFISNKINPTRDSECYINFASDVVAMYSQNRMNLALNSSINLYSAFEYICTRSGMRSVHIDPELKKTFLNEAKAYYASASTILNSQALQGGEYTLSSDGSEGTVIDVTTRKGKRLIALNSRDIPFLNQPTVSSEGLSFTILPIFSFKIGDIVQMDNSIIDISSAAAEAKNVFNSNYMDTNGQYMIIKIDYQLQNRDHNFQFKIQARALDIISKIEVNQ